MCRKSQYQPLSRPIDKQDVQAVKQALRIKIWQIIARNNAEVLFDPLLQPLENSMPYIERAVSDERVSSQPSAEKPEKVEDIKPTLDEVLPLPEKEKADGQKPKKKAKDLLTSDTAKKDDNQIAVDEAIAAANDDVSTPPKGDKSSSDKQPVEAQTPACAHEGAAEAMSSDKQSADAHASSTAQEAAKAPDKPHRRTVADVLQEHLIEGRKQKERDAYFNSRQVQINNKNAACYELLTFLDEM